MAAGAPPSLGPVVRLAAALLVALALASCAQRLMPSGPGPTEPRLAEDRAIAGDGMVLPLRAWLPEGEPRAVILARLAAELVREKSPQKQNTLKTLEQIGTTVGQVMAERGKRIYPNVEFYKGVVFDALGIPTDCFTSMFVLARSFGWAAHILELWQDHRLYRPLGHYVGNAAAAS